MKNIICLMFIFIISAAAVSAAEEPGHDINQLFYSGNSYYEKQEYQKATDDYMKALDTGMTSGRLYYNIGNGFFKLGKIGYAILYYERAKRIMPHDSDLMSNLTYARSLVGSTALQSSEENIITSIIKAPFNEFSLNKVTAICAVFYLLMMSVLVFFISNPIAAKKFMLLLPISILIFLISLAAFSIRLYDEEILKRGIVIQKEADAKYEPIDRSTTYYKLQEGDQVVVIKTKNEWRQVRRIDGKIAWVPKETVEII